MRAWIPLQHICKVASEYVWRMHLCMVSLWCTPWWIALIPQSQEIYQSCKLFGKAVRKEVDYFYYNWEAESLSKTPSSIKNEYQFNNSIIAIKMVIP